MLPLCFAAGDLSPDTLSAGNFPADTLLGGGLLEVDDSFVSGVFVEVKVALADEIYLEQILLDLN